MSNLPSDYVRMKINKFTGIAKKRLACYVSYVT